MSKSTSAWWRCSAPVVSSHCVQIARRLGRTARADVAARAGEGQPILVRARLAADAREAVVVNMDGCNQWDRTSDLVVVGSDKTAAPSTSCPPSSTTGTTFITRPATRGTRRSGAADPVEMAVPGSWLFSSRVRAEKSRRNCGRCDPTPTGAERVSPHSSRPRPRPAIGRRANSPPAS